MTVTKKPTRMEMIARHEEQDYDPFAGKSGDEVARINAKPSVGSPPTSVRLSKPLLDRLDQIARQQHRSRGNLIQYILWAYAHKDE